MRTERETTICPSEITATSLVPPPTSRTMRPTGSAMGTPAPIAAAIDSSMRCTCRAPADRAASSTARRSTSVIPDGAHTTRRGCARRRSSTLAMKWRSIFSVTSKSAMTPWRSGRVAEIVAGVRPIIRCASAPTAGTSPVRSSIATTDGSDSTMPRPRTWTTVFAVPRSMAMSRTGRRARAERRTACPPSVLGAIAYRVPERGPGPRAASCNHVGMHWQVYLSGEIHPDWRERIAQGVAGAGLDLELTGPVTEHAASDDCGVAILGDEDRAFWKDHVGAGVNAIRTRTLLERADVVVVRFGEQYRQWNAAFDAGYAAALGKPLVTLHPEEHDHALKEVDRAALAVAREPEQVVEVLRYVLEGRLPARV